MATQYTDILKLALPIQGELIGSWGDTINDEITSMVEQAIAGMSVINTWTTNSHTLTVVNGATSQSRAAILRLTDTGTALTGAGTVICPDQSKIYLVDNNTGRAVTVKTSAGTGISVPNTTTALLFCDATNVLNGMTFLPYDNTTSGLTATTVQVAIDELTSSEGSVTQGLANHLADTVDAHDASAISFDNAASELTATEVQAALDELDGLLDTNTTNIGTNTTDITNLETAVANTATVIPQTGGGALTALRINELRDGNTGYTLPLANSISVNQTITITLPDEFKANTPVVTRAGSDTISYSGTADTSITFNTLSSVSITLTSDGTSGWSL